MVPVSPGNSEYIAFDAFSALPVVISKPAIASESSAFGRFAGGGAVSEFAGRLALPRKCQRVTPWWNRSPTTWNEDGEEAFAMTSPRRLRKYALAATLDLCKKSSQGPGCLGKFAGMISGRTGAEQGPSRAERNLLRMSPKQTQARFRSAVFAKPHISATRANLSWTMRLCTAPRLLCLPHSLGLHNRSQWINYSRGANAYGAGQKKIRPHRKNRDSHDS